MVARFGEVDGPRFSPKFDLRSAASDKMRTVEKLTSSRVYEIRAQWDSEAGVWGQRARMSLALLLKPIRLMLWFRS